MGCRCQLEVARLFARSRKIEFQSLRVEREVDLDPEGFFKGKDGARAGMREIRGIMLHITIVADVDKARDFVDREKPLYRKVSPFILVRSPEWNRHYPVSGSGFSCGSRKAAFGFTIGSHAHVGQ
jgi:hypothetical protein